MCSCESVLVFVFLSIPLSFYRFFDDVEYYLFYVGYKLEKPIQHDSDSIKGYLYYKGSSEYFRTDQSMIYKNLSLKIEFEADDELSILITDSDDTRFSLPYETPFPFTKKRNRSNNTLYEIQYGNEGSFHFKVLRKQTKEVIFNTENHHLIFSDKYLEIGTDLASSYIYGLGEHTRKFRLEPGTYTIWPTDQNILTEDQSIDTSSYGYHPVYLAREKSTNYHIVFFRTSNAMDVIYRGESLIYKVVGGRIELKFFLGDRRPDTAIELYHNYINGFGLMPFWAFGYHQSRWGYEDSKEFVKVIDNFKLSKLPIDVIWVDIDYMDRYKDFTVDNFNFFIEDFRKIGQNGLKLVPVIDLGIEYCNYTACKEAKARNVFIKSNYTDSPLLNSVWPFVVAYPDFNNPNTTEFWSKYLKELHETIKFDGIWLDMNEPSAIVNGEFIDPEFEKVFFKKNHSARIYPYLPGRRPLDYKTISPNAYHESHGIFINQSAALTELDFHSLNGLAETKSTYDFLKTLGHELPFIISRNNIFGSGKYSGHWTGDNNSTWSHMKISISNIFNYQIFGIPFLGADICGFQLNSTEELCARWMQLGAFYPFSRNHNTMEGSSQEPYSWGPSSIVFKASMASLKLRYSLIKYYYMLFIKANGTGTIFRPLSFEFIEDDRTLAIDEQFLIGSDLLVAPVLQPGVSEIKIYIPFNSTFFCYYCGEKYHPPRWHKISAPINNAAPLFIKEGSIVFTNYVTRVQRTSELNNHYKLKVALKEKPFKGHNFSYILYEAKGLILGIANFEDKNVIEKCINKGCLVSLEVTAMKSRLDLDKEIFQIELVFQNDSDIELEEVYVDELEIYGLCSKTGFKIRKYEFETPYRVQLNAQKRIILEL